MEVILECGRASNDIHRVELRFLEEGEYFGNRVHRAISWAHVSSAKKLPVFNGEENVENNSLASIFGLSIVGKLYSVGYVELRVGDIIVGGYSKESFNFFKVPSLLVREKLNFLPTKYAKRDGDESQFSFLSSDSDHNIRAILYSYLSHNSLLPKTSKERRVAIDSLVRRNAFVYEAIKFHKLNGANLISAPSYSQVKKLPSRNYSE